MLRRLLASHTQLLVLENVSAPETSFLSERLCRQVEEMEQGLVLNYHFWMCCQPALVAVTVFDGSVKNASNSMAGNRGKMTWEVGMKSITKGPKAWQVAERGGSQDAE